MDQAAKERIMSSEYKKNDGMATDWSKRAQSAADRNEPKSQSEAASELKTTLIPISIVAVYIQYYYNTCIFTSKCIYKDPH